MIHEQDVNPQPLTWDIIGPPTVFQELFQFLSLHSNSCDRPKFITSLDIVQLEASLILKHRHAALEAQ